MIIGNPKARGIKDLRGYAEALNLDLARFDAVMADPKRIDQLLKLDFDEAARCKVNATPTVMINGLKLSGDRSIESYKARIDGLLKSAAVNRTGALSERHGEAAESSLVSARISCLSL